MYCSIVTRGRVRDTVVLYAEALLDSFSKKKICLKILSLKYTQSTGLTINKYTWIYRYILGRKISLSIGMWKKSIHSKDTYNVGGKWSNTVMIPPHGLVDVFRLYGRRDFQGTSYPTLWIKTKTEYYIQIVLAIHFHLDSQSIHTSQELKISFPDIHMHLSSIILNLEDLRNQGI